MKLVVGLGNPGPRYETTRHNAGFLAIDRIADLWKAGSFSKAFDAEVAPVNLGGEKLLLVKPMTFMNLSGKSVGPIARFYKCAPADIVVIHDEVDLPPLQLRFKTGGGHGGHNGLKSVDSALGSQDYHRIRIGVGKPGGAGAEGVELLGRDNDDDGDESIGRGGRVDTAGHVLQPFTNAELQGLDSVLDDVAAACQMILRGEILQAMNQYHSRNHRPRT